MTIFEILRDKGFGCVPESFYAMIGVWKSWYDGDVKGFHNYRVFNGQKSVQCRRYTMGMGKKLAEDWANLLMNEKVKITLEGELEQAFVDSVFLSNRFAVKANEMQEMKAALGTAAYVCSVTGAQVRKEDGALVDGSRAGVCLDYVEADRIFPLSWKNGTIQECAFASAITRKTEKYLYLQVHSLDSGGIYVVENLLYRDREGNLDPVPLTAVAGFESVVPAVWTGSDKPLFVIDRLNIVNNVDIHLPMGISVFANAIDQLKGVDVAYDSYVNEFILGKKRIMVKPEATKDLDGDPVFDPNDTVYYVLPEDSQNGSLISPIDMSLRTAEHSAGIQDMLNALSSKCGFGENHYRYNSGSISTATQVISENSTMFRTIKKHEVILEAALKELCRIILRLGNSVLSLGLDEDVEISVDFDDSIIEDKQADFARDMQLLSAGILNAWEFRAKWLNEDEATAKSSLPGMEELTTEKQDEVE